LQFYSILLSKRLINGLFDRSNEMIMLGKLKQVCAYEKIYKLQRMFYDLDLSEELNVQFNEMSSTTNSEITPNNNVTFQVLTSGSWPMFYVAPNLITPAPIERALEMFSEFYNTKKYSGRRLTWLHSISRGVVQAHMPNSVSSHDLHVTGMQLSVLLMYNDSNVLSVDSIMQGTKMSEEEVTSVAQSLCKASLLVAESSNDQVTQYSINMKFTSKLKKLPVYAYMVLNMNEQESAKAHKQIGDDRKYTIQAAIVRIMKARKVMQFNDLVVQVIQQIQQQHFRPSSSDVKRCIDGLIEQEFLERDAHVLNQLKYVS